MLKNHLRVALRGLRGQKMYAVINMAGLAIGLACFLLILLYIRHEQSYDRHFENADQIYRVITHNRQEDSETTVAVTPMPLGPVLVDEFPEVLHAARIENLGEPRMLISYGDKHFVETQFWFADSTFFDVFPIRMLKGNPRTALTEPMAMVITEDIARKYFGDEDPINKILILEGKYELIVTGVVENPPATSHFHFNFLLSFVTRGPATDWGISDAYTYIVLPPGYDANQLESKLPQIVDKYIASNDGVLIEGEQALFLQPVKDIHLRSHLNFEIEANGDVTYVYLFAAVAVLILLVACINFINLTTARSDGRAKEVGVRKALGSNRKQLVMQFLSESTLQSFASLILAVGVFSLLHPVFTELVGRSIDPGLLLNVPTVVGVVVVVIVVGVLAGSYPAFLLSSFKPAVVLRGRFKSAPKSRWLRNSLVVFQFAATIGLIGCTLIVGNQLDFVRNKKLGFDKENVVVVRRAWTLGAQRDAFKQEMLKHSNVFSVSAASTLPGFDRFPKYTLRVEQPDGEQSFNVDFLETDHDFAATLGVPLVDGRDFSRDFASDSAGVLVNQAAVKAFGWTTAVGKQIKQPNGTVGTVVGVLENFNHKSLHQSVDPLSAWIGADVSFLAMRIDGRDVATTLALLEKTWRQFAGTEPLEYSFLDANLTQLYQADQRIGRLFGAFALLAIVIACLGAFGLAAYTAEQRTKEIGIRKALGASTAGIVLMFWKEIARLVVVALVVISPVTFFVMNRWLDNFSYQIAIGPSVFLVAGLMMLVIATLTISHQSIKAALANPVESLRAE